jgi:branched-chain amino acid transport system substrate-binding protein
MIRLFVRLFMRGLKILLLFSVFLAGCGRAPEGSGRATSGEIIVGEYGSLTGSEATFGQETHNAIMIAIDEVNAAGGVNGRKVRVITEDTQSKPEEAATAVTKLITKHNIVAGLGEVASSSSLAAAPIFQAHRIPMITPSSTNPAVTQVGDFIFRPCYIDSYQGETMADYLADKMGIKTVAILTDVKTDYSTGLRKFFGDQFVKNGGRIVAQLSYAKGDSDFRSQLTAIRAANPQVIFIPGYYSDIGQIAIQARDLGLKQVLVGTDGWESPKLIEIGGKALEGAYYSTHYAPTDPNPLVQNFVTKYRQRHNRTPDGLAALAYDAARLLADALRRAGSTDGRAIRDAIASTKGFPGVTGTITIGPDRNPRGKDVVIVEVRNGELVLKDRIAGR